MRKVARKQVFGGRHRGEMLDVERVFGEHGFCERLFEPSSVWLEHLFDVNTDARFLHRPRMGPEIPQLQTQEIPPHVAHQ